MERTDRKVLEAIDDVHLAKKRLDLAVDNLRAAGEDELGARARELANRIDALEDDICDLIENGGGS